VSACGVAAWRAQRRCARARCACAKRGVRRGACVQRVRKRERLQCNACEWRQAGERRAGQREARRGRQPRQRVARAGAAEGACARAARQARGTARVARAAAVRRRRVAPANAVQGQCRCGGGGGRQVACSVQRRVQARSAGSEGVARWCAGVQSAVACAGQQARARWCVWCVVGVGGVWCVQRQRAGVVCVCVVVVVRKGDCRLQKQVLGA